MSSKVRVSLIVWMCATAGAGTTPEASLPMDASSGIEMDQVQVTCRIDGRQLAVTVDFEARATQAQQRMVLVRGDAVLETLDPSAGQIDYDPNNKAYGIVWPRPGRHHVVATFMAQSLTEPNSPWREASLQVPAGRVRQIRLVASEPDLEIQLPRALRVQRRIDEGQLVVEAMLGPGEPLTVRWKPQVQLADAKLVLSSHAHTVVNVRAGLMQVDTLFDFEVAQGRLEALTFNVPTDLSVTALDGAFIRTWTLGAAADGTRPLRVELSRAQDKSYRLRIRGERPIDTVPSTVEIPAIEPTGDIRASCHLAVGTDSALQLVVQESSGLTQVDAIAFPRIQVQHSAAGGAGPDPGQAQGIAPTGKVFFYTCAGGRYRLRLLVDDVVSSYEVAERLVAKVKEDDLVLDADLELDVRDAPVRQLEIAAPPGLIVAAVDGNEVEDYHLPQAPTTGQPTVVRVVFKRPVIGRTLLHLRLELGRSPLGEQQSVWAPQVVGARMQRGYVVVAADAGIEIDPPQVRNLREVHTASVPLRVPQTQYAYRFREANWTLNLVAQGRPAEIRTEVFHLESIGEALAYGSAVVNYVITGAPLDELRFSLPEDFENVEFVGREVRRWVREGDEWVVKLATKVLGDYSLAVTYTQRYGPDRPIQLGALTARGVQTQTGYVAVTSHLDLRLQAASNEADGQAGLSPIALDELPGDYRLLTSSPILAAYKYVTEPHVTLLTISPYERSVLLPVVVDIADLQTRLAVRPDRRMESVTAIRYKVKNTTGQFLALTMPAGARVWAVAQIQTRPDGTEQSTRLAASHDQDNGQLLIPLPRQANPNDPATIELEYGQVHQAGAWWKRRVDLTAPRCEVPIVYADWQVIVPDRWAVAFSGGGMQAQPQARLGLADLAKRIASSWERALHRTFMNGALGVFGAIAAVLVAAFAVLKRDRVPDLVVLAALTMAVWVGMTAATDRLVLPEPLTRLNCAQAVSADPGRALEVSVGIVPAWRRAIRGSDVVGAGVIIMAALGLAIGLRRLRKVALAAAVAALLYVAARVPDMWPVLKALATWGVPVAAAFWFAYHSWRREAIPARAAVLTLILLAASINGGCSAPGFNLSSAGGSQIERVECSLAAGADSMEMRYSLRVVTDRPARLPLADESAVLISPAKPCAHVVLQTQTGQYVIQVDRPGVYDVEAVFVAPLAPAGEDQQRRFELTLPMALTNRVRLAVPDANMSVEAPRAVFLTSRQQEGQTSVEAMFAPGQPAVFTWRPLERQAAREEVRFYAQDLALARVTPGLLQVSHEVRLQIAQGQVDRLTLEIAPGQAVTSVNGPQIGAWRFDPVGHRLEVRLNRPATGSYTMILVTQSASAAVPYDVQLQPLVIERAVDQHSVVGLAAEPSVYVRLDRHPAAMNVQDYAREARELIEAAPGLAVEQITQAFRFGPEDSAVTGRVLAVQSEIRSQETARFNVEDDRLVYNSEWTIEIAKTGRFDVDLLMPDGFDIDALEAEQVSHWDESTEAGRRRTRVYFKHRLTGSVPLRLALSQPLVEVPDRLTVPRVTVTGALKHTGHLLIGSAQGLRLSVASRQGVSEINPAELGQSGRGFMAFQFLRPDWKLQLQTEQIQARVTVQSLHVARVTDGLVRHRHALRYRLYNAGTKTFGLTLPPDAVGVTITGSGIARREQSEAGQWRVELADKVYDRPYLMSVAYETRYSPADGNVALVPVRCRDADLQQGYVAVFATGRMRLAVGSTDAILRPADARSIPEYFGAGDLSAAAMCFRSVSPQYALIVRARRHTAADQIGAEVAKTDLVSVVTAAGQTINRVVLRLRVGSQRHLQTILPEGAALWSLAVDGQAVQPSVRTTAEGCRALLVPLPQQAADDVLMDMVYVGCLPSTVGGGRTTGWSGHHSLSGPRFDLPLKNISWQVYVPDDFTYGNFGGTVAMDPRTTEVTSVPRYDLQAYQQQILEVNRMNEQVAQHQQSRARELAKKGEQTAARQALTKGYNFSLGNAALNEDIRVDLDNLLRQQAKVGLINARGRLRQQSGALPDGRAPDVIPTDTQGFSQQQAERIDSSLGQADSENLELIIRRIMQTQAAAETSVCQLQVTMPVCGRMLRFGSPLQVEPAAEMAVVFAARPRHLARIDPSLWCGFGLFAFLLICGVLVNWVRRPWRVLCIWLQKAPALAGPVESSEPSRSEGPEQADGRVSTEELL